MTKRKWFPILIAVVATALFILPGLAFGGGGGGNNGTPSPPPSNPPCDADGHNGSPPPYAGPNKNSGSCDHGTSGSTGEGTTNGTNGQPSNPPCDADNHAVQLPPGLKDKCPSSTSTSGSSGGSSSSSGSSGSSGSTGTTTADVCVTDGIFGSKGLGLNSPDDRTIGQIVWDELGLVVQDPQIPPGGPISGPLHDGLIMIPLGGLETPISAEVGCLLNNLSL
jgi:hypothetical protein